MASSPTTGTVSFLVLSLAIVWSDLGAAYFDPEALCGGTPAVSEAESTRDAIPETREHRMRPRWWQGATATGNWGGTRESLEQRGVIPEGLYTFDASSVLAGGLRHTHATRGLLEIGVTLDMERLASWRGATFFAGVQSFRGRVGSDDTGDAQGYSNIDAERFDDLAEIWFEQRLAGDRVRMKIGRVDANNEFAFVRAADEFVNSSAGFSPTILNLPTYPYPAPSVNLAVRPSERVSLRFGVYDSASNRGADGGAGRTLFSIGEVGIAWAGRGPGTAGRFAIGGWHDSGTVERFDGGLERGSAGLYALIEQRLLTIGGRSGRPGTVLSLFAQFGSSDGWVSEFARHFSLGIVADHPIPTREDDAAGLLVSHADLSDAYGAGFAADETVLELFYRFRITPFLFLKPDLQFVRNPFGDPAIPDAVVGTMRVEIAF